MKGGRKETSLKEVNLLVQSTFGHMTRVQIFLSNAFYVELIIYNLLSIIYISCIVCELLHENGVYPKYF